MVKLDLNSDIQSRCGLPISSDAYEANQKICDE